MTNPFEQNIDLPELSDFSIALGEARYKLDRAVAVGRVVMLPYVALIIDKIPPNHTLASYNLVDRSRFREAMYGLAEIIEIGVPIFNGNPHKPIRAVGDDFDYFRVTGLHEGKVAHYVVNESTFDDLNENPALPTFHVLHKMLEYSPLPVEIPES